MEISDIERLELKPGDRIVITVPGTISRQAEQLIQRRLTELFPGVQGMILCGGMKLSIVSAPDEPVIVG